MPIFGPLLRKIAVARFTRTMATLIASGVPILDCLEITAKTSGNAIVEEAIFNVKSAIEEGRTIVGTTEGIQGLSSDGGSDGWRWRTGGRSRSRC